MVRTYIESLGGYKFIQKLFGNTKRSAYRYTENILDKYNNLIEYKYLHNATRRLNQIKSDQPITLANNLNLGSTINQVRNQFKVKPFVKAYSSKGVRRTILLYKIKLDGQKIKVEAHFYKNQLFFSKYIISDVTESDRNNFLSLFSEKYSLQNLEFENKNIVDSNNNCAKIENGLELSISYMQLNNLFFEKMQEKTAINTQTIPLTYGVNLGVQ